jgi:hypothetical protein
MATERPTGVTQTGRFPAQSLGAAAPKLAQALVSHTEIGRQAQFRAGLIDIILHQSHHFLMRRRGRFQLEDQSA